MSSLKAVFASAAIVGTFALSGAALAGAEPVTPAVSVPATTVIVIPVGGGGGGVSLPSFFTVTPPQGGGLGTFTFSLSGRGEPVSNNPIFGGLGSDAIIGGTDGAR
jgi:hypothetical protein